MSVHDIERAARRLVRGTLRLEHMYSGVPVKAMLGVVGEMRLVAHLVMLLPSLAGCVGGETDGGFNWLSCFFV